MKLVVLKELRELKELKEFFASEASKLERKTIDFTLVFPKESLFGVRGVTGV